MGTVLELGDQLEILGVKIANLLGRLQPTKTPEQDIASRGKSPSDTGLIRAYLIYQFLAPAFHNMRMLWEHHLPLILLCWAEIRSIWRSIDLSYTTMFLGLQCTLSSDQNLIHGLLTNYVIDLSFGCRLNIAAPADHRCPHCFRCLHRLCRCRRRCRRCHRSHGGCCHAA